VVELALETFVLLKAIGATENLYGGTATLGEGLIRCFELVDLGLEFGGALLQMGAALSEDAAVELHEIAVIAGELVRKGELSLGEYVLDIREIKLDFVLKTALDLGEVMARVVEQGVALRDLGFDGVGGFTGERDFLGIEVKAVKGTDFGADLVAFYGNASLEFLEIRGTYANFGLEFFLSICEARDLSISAVFVSEEFAI
jgi:hypothetical protein